MFFFNQFYVRSNVIKQVLISSVLVFLFSYSFYSVGGAQDLRRETLNYKKISETVIAQYSTALPTYKASTDAANKAINAANSANITTTAKELAIIKTTANQAITLAEKAKALCEKAIANSKQMLVINTVINNKIRTNKISKSIAKTTKDLLFIYDTRVGVKALHCIGLARTYYKEIKKAKKAISIANRLQADL